MKTDASHHITTVPLSPTAAGARRDPLVHDRHRCSFVPERQHLDCALLLEKLGDVWRGQVIAVPIRFLGSGSALPRSQLGELFELREDAVIADGIIVETKT